MNDDDPKKTAEDQDTNADDGRAGTLDKPRASDEGGPKVDDPIPDA
jgi:hypothetical protein